MEVVFVKASGTMENMENNIGVYELFVGYFPLHVYAYDYKVVVVCVGNLVFHPFVFANHRTNVCN
jgi:hypothetical protein